MPTTRRLLAALRPYAGLFAVAIGASAVGSLLDGATVVLLIPFLKLLFGTAGALETGATDLEYWIDRVVGPLIAARPASQAALVIMGILIGALLLKNALLYVRAHTSTHIEEGLARDLRSGVFEHLLKVDLAYLQSTRGGQMLATLVADADQVKTAVAAALASLIQNAIVILVTLVILASISFRLTVLALLTAPVLLLGVQTLVRRLREHARAGVEERGELTGTAVERLSAMKLIRASGTETEEGRLFRGQADRYRKWIIRTQRFAQLTSPASEVFGGLVLILVIWAATVPALAGAQLGPEVTIVFLLAFLKMMSPLKSLTQFPAQWATAGAAAERVFRLMDLPVVEQDAPGARPAVFTQSLRFDRVSFRYGEGELVLREVSFEMQPGQVVALVGPSGSGKTTLAELVPRFWDPSGGRILLDDVPLNTLTRASLRELIAIVGQDTMLLNDTVHANIAYGRAEASRDQVRAAADAANASGFIEELPDGFDTVLGERGTRLSGGQRQRIAIARALLRDAPILILDEATSALDTESELLVQQAIDHLMQNRTVLVIAHRLSTVRHADLILVLDRGRVVQRGSHEALVQEGGLYRRLYDLQFRGLEVAVS